MMWFVKKCPCLKKYISHKSVVSVFEIALNTILFWHKLLHNFKCSHKVV